MATREHFVRIRRACVLAATLTFVDATHGADLSRWAASYDPGAKARFIPVELWTGAEWDGERELKMAATNLSFGKHVDKSISGPFPWKRPGSPERGLVSVEGD